MLSIVVGWITTRPPMTSLFTRHAMLLQTTFSELKRQASEQAFVLVGTPGSVGVRQVKGRGFYYRQFYDAAGRKSAQYIGPVRSPEAEARAEAIRSQIALATALAKEARGLAERGYVRADARTGAIVASFANHGLFRAGATLIGSHAYGALLNELGVRAAAFMTEDIDLARGARLALGERGEQKVAFADVLEASTVPLVPVPALSPNIPSTSYKGRERLRVDLLVPSGGAEVGIKAVPELGAHATALPHLRALLEEPIESVLLTREGATAIRVPRPEAFVWHKMQLPSLRGASDKKRKDVLQASVLFAVLAEDAPDALAESLAALSAPARRRLVDGATQALRLIEATPHERALELLVDLVPALRRR
ncbi:MAG: hypothetical protein KF764_10035 [Labilithrix sp.]|nr:hypothetical protein [Labilithrix sp.]